MKRLIALIAVCFVDMIGLMIVAPLLPFFAVRLGATPSLVGPLVSAFAVAVVARTGIPAGISTWWTIPRSRSNCGTNGVR